MKTSIQPGQSTQYNPGPTLKPECIQASSQAKCLLTGSHTVLRGGLAVACSIPLQLDIRYTKHAHTHGIVFKGLRDECAEKKFLHFFQHALALCGLTWAEFPGVLSIHNDIPIGSGLGSSAALSCAVAKLFAQESLIEDSANNITSFAHQLENYFHGQSSGIDVYASLTAPHCLALLQHGQYKTHPISWLPHLALSPSHIQSKTKEAIKKVHEWRQLNHSLADDIDKQMHMSSQLCKLALSMHTPSKTRFNHLKEALHLSQNCYQTWGLIPAPIQKIQSRLYQVGAEVVTQTGGGDGGHILSLWHEKPSIHLQTKLDLTWIW